MACRQKRYPRNSGRRDRRRVPPRRHHASTVGRNSSSPFPASWSYTSCSELLCVQRTRQRGTTTPLTASDKASPPLVSIPFPGPETNDHNPVACVPRSGSHVPPAADVSSPELDVSRSRRNVSWCSCPPAASRDTRPWTGGG